VVLSSKRKTVLYHIFAYTLVNAHLSAAGVVLSLHIITILSNTCEPTLVTNHFHALCVVRVSDREAAEIDTSEQYTRLTDFLHIQLTQSHFILLLIVIHQS
jgi:hypothetical protein